MMQELKISRDVINLCQNHVVGSKVDRSYLHYDFKDEKREAWQMLGKRLFEYIKTIKDQDQVLLTDGAINFDIEKLLPMFGARGHILMRTAHQFQIMEAFINVFQAHQDSFDILTPARADKKLISKAEYYNFKLIVIGSETEKGQAYKGYQLDTYTDSVEGENFQQRCAIVLKQENTGYARNSNNWILLIIVFITYLKSLKI